MKILSAIAIVWSAVVFFSWCLFSVAKETPMVEKEQ